MTVKVTIADQAPTEEKVSVKVASNESVSVKISGPNTMVLEYNLNVRRALNGDLMVFDHHDIDVIILTEKKKIVAFAKDLMSDAVYGAQKRMFDHLRRRGVISFDSIEGGSVYGSLQGMLLESKEVDVIKMTLYEISKWMETEKPLFDQSYDEMVDDSLLHPNQDDSTELGEVPHEDTKGSINTGNLFAPYLYGRYTY